MTGSEYRNRLYRRATNSQPCVIQALKRIITKVLYQSMLPARTGGFDDLSNASTFPSNRIAVLEFGILWQIFVLMRGFFKKLFFQVFTMSVA